MNFSTTTKINIDIITEWLNNSLSNNPSDYGIINFLKKNNRRFSSDKKYIKKCNYKRWI